MAADSNTLRRAAAAAQAVLREVDSSLIIDGRAGSFTAGVFDRSPDAVKAAVNVLVRALGFPGGFVELRTAFAVASAKPSGESFFDLTIVPAVVREGRSRGLNPVFVLTQLALESGYGRNSPMGDDGKPSLNFAGLKWNAVTPRTTRTATAKTAEYVKGSRVNERAVFAAFDDAGHFARSYYDYVLSGPSSYRYKGLADAKTAREFGDILQRGGYATDPAYGVKFASIASSVERRYSLA